MEKRYSKDVIIQRLADWLLASKKGSKNWTGLATVKKLLVVGKKSGIEPKMSPAEADSRKLASLRSGLEYRRGTKIISSRRDDGKKTREPISPPVPFQGRFLFLRRCSPAPFVAGLNFPRGPLRGTFPARRKKSRAALPPSVFLSYFPASGIWNRPTDAGKPDVGNEFFFSPRRKNPAVRMGDGSNWLFAV